MVAYSFNRRFIDRIETGTKSQTVRGGRRHHAKPGQTIQLYTAMRTKVCRKIAPDAVCISSLPVTLFFGGNPVLRVEVAGREVDARYFAQADGFTDESDLAAFWRDENGVQPGDTFHGTLIEWHWPAPEDRNDT
jgi:hypothetical protein